MEEIMSLVKKYEKKIVNINNQMNMARLHIQESDIEKVQFLFDYIFHLKQKKDFYKKVIEDLENLEVG